MSNGCMINSDLRPLRTLVGEDRLMVRTLLQRDAIQFVQWQAQKDPQSAADFDKFC